MVAEVNGRKITLAEVDAKWQEFDAAERARLTQLLYQNRRNMLDLVMGDVLIADAAKAANLGVEAYTERELARRLQPVTDAEVQRFYEENKERTQGRTAGAAASTHHGVPRAASGSSRRERSWSTTCEPRPATSA